MDQNLFHIFAKHDHEGRVFGDKNAPLMSMQRNLFIARGSWSSATNCFLIARFLGETVKNICSQ